MTSNLREDIWKRVIWILSARPKGKMGNITTLNENNDGIVSKAQSKYCFVKLIVELCQLALVLTTSRAGWNTAYCPEINLA